MVNFKVLASKLDLLAPQHELRVGGRSRLQTIPGAFLTLLNLAAVVLASVFIFMQYLKTDNPTLSEESINKEDYPKIDLVKHNLLPFFVAYYDDVLPLPAAEIPKFLTVTYNKYKYISDPKNPTEQPTLVTTKFKVLPCGELLAQGKSHLVPSVGSPVLKGMIESVGVCMDVSDGEGYVMGREADPEYDIASLEIFPCTLTEGCAPPEDYRKISFVMTLPSALANYSNYEKPISYKASADDYYYLNPTTGQRYHTRLMTGEIYDTRPGFGKKTLRTTYAKPERVLPSQIERNLTKFSCDASELDDWTCAPYFVFEWVSGGLITQVTREYKGIFQTLGEIGGIKEIIAMVFSFLYAWYHTRARKSIILHKVFGLDEATIKKLPKSTILTCLNFADDSVDVYTLIRNCSLTVILAQAFMDNHQKRLAPLTAAILLDSSIKQYKGSSNQAEGDGGAANQNEDLNTAFARLPPIQEVTSRASTDPTTLVSTLPPPLFSRYLDTLFALTLPPVTSPPSLDHSINPLVLDTNIHGNYCLPSVQNNYNRDKSEGSTLRSLHRGNGQIG